MEISWKSKAWGREADLLRLNKLKNDDTKGPKTRLGADRAHTKITMHLKDKKYTNLREHLINATRAEDTEAARKIELQIREYLKEPLEAFS